MRLFMLNTLNDCFACNQAIFLSALLPTTSRQQKPYLLTVDTANVLKKISPLDIILVRAFLTEIS